MAEEVFTAEVFSSRIVDELSDPIRDAVLTAILTDNDIPSYMMAALLNGFAIKMNRYLDYGESNYINGLPTAHTTGTGVDLEKVDAFIDDQLGTDVDTDVAVVDLPQAHYFGYEYLQNYTDFEFEPNTVTIDIWQEDLQYWAPTVHKVLSIYFDDQYFSGSGKIRIDLQEETIFDDGALHSITFTRPPNEDFLHVQYHLKIETVENALFWTYKVSDGGLEDISLPDTITEGKFYPIAPIRINEKFIDEDKDSEEYKTTEKLLSKVNVDLDDVIKAISEEEDGTPNEDLEYLHDAFILFAADLYSEQESTIEYMFRYFEKLAETAVVDREAFEIGVGQIDVTRANPPTNRFTVTEEHFNVDIEYNWIETAVHSGTISQYTNYNTVFEQVGDGIDSTTWCTGGEIVDGAYVTLPVCHSVQVATNLFHIQRQNSDNTYTEITVSGLIHRVRVTAFDYTRSINKVMDPKYLDPPSGEEGTGGFYIPCNFEILEEMSMKDRSEAAEDMLTLVLYAADLQKLKWYQTGFFAALLQFVLTLIAVILFVVALPAGATFSFIIMALFQQILMTLIIGFILELLIKTVGVELAAIIAVAATLIGMYRGGSFAGLSKLPFADLLLRATQVLQKLVGVYTEVTGKAMEMEYDAFLKEQDQIQEDMDKASDLLEDESSVFDWMNVIQAESMPNPNEKPGDFYTRTVHIGNPGVLSLDVISGYVDDALQLPMVDLTNDGYHSGAPIV